MPVAIFIQEVMKIPGVSRAWFEWNLLAENDSHTRTLVVEVTMNTDPNSDDFDSGTLSDIVDAIKNARTTAVFSHLRIVPKGAYNG